MAHSLFTEIARRVVWHLTSQLPFVSTGVLRIPVTLYENLQCCFGPSRSGLRIGTGVLHLQRINRGMQCLRVKASALRIWKDSRLFVSTWENKSLSMRFAFASQGTLEVSQFVVAEASFSAMEDENSQNGKDDKTETNITFIELSSQTSKLNKTQPTNQINN